MTLPVLHSRLCPALSDTPLFPALQRGPVCRNRSESSLESVAKGVLQSCTIDVPLDCSGAGAIKWNVDGATLENAFCNALKAALRTVPTNRSTLEGWEKRGVGQGGTQPRVKYGQRHPQSSGNKRPLFVRDEQSRTGNHKRQNI